MYHRIADAKADPWRLAVPPALFDEQLDFLKRHRMVLPLVEFGRLHRRGRLPAKAVAITFDDGYACNARTAAPLLEKHRLPATIFVATGPISSQEEFWWDALEHIILSTEAESLEVPINGTVIPIKLGRRDDPDDAINWNAAVPVTTRQAAYLDLWWRLRQAGEETRRIAIATLHRQVGTASRARGSHRAMTMDELRETAASRLIEIGAHTVTHPVLSRLTRAEQLSEIIRSRDFCHNQAGYEPRAFSYPFGDYNDNTVAVVAEAGFEIACTVRETSVGRRAHKLEMPRLKVNAWSALELRTFMKNLERP
jgi:peptidoglycan/xylan/chitin deacetylase (PgdA/CDA1 family)